MLKTIIIIRDTTIASNDGLRGLLDGNGLSVVVSVGVVGLGPVHFGHRSRSCRRHVFTEQIKLFLPYCLRSFFSEYLHMAFSYEVRRTRSSWIRPVVTKRPSSCPPPTAFNQTIRNGWPFSYESLLVRSECRDTGIRRPHAQNDVMSTPYFEVLNAFGGSCMHSQVLWYTLSFHTLWGFGSTLGLCSMHFCPLMNLGR